MPAGYLGVLDGHEVGMRPVRSTSRQLEHLRSKRREDQRHRRVRLGRRVLRRIHRVQIGRQFTQMRTQMFQPRAIRPRIRRPHAEF